jgi:hypothetical protein
MVRSIVVVFVLFFSLSARGQLYEFDSPEPLPFNVNSDAQEAMPLLSHDGKRLYFARALYELNVGGRYAGHDIWESERTSSGWTRASNTDLRFNTKANEAVIGVGRDGNTLYLMRTMPDRKVSGVYVSRRSRGVWSEPELIPIEGLESQQSLGFYMHPDGDVLLISMRASDSHGQEDLYISLKSSYGTWSKAKNLGTTINTSGFEISCISQATGIRGRVMLTSLSPTGCTTRGRRGLYPGTWGKRSTRPSSTHTLLCTATRWPSLRVPETVGSQIFIPPG